MAGSVGIEMTDIWLKSVRCVVKIWLKCGWYVPISDLQPSCIRGVIEMWLSRIVKVSTKESINSKILTSNLNTFVFTHCSDCANYFVTYFN